MQMIRLCLLLSVVCGLSWRPPVFGEPPEMRLRLKDGSFSTGHLLVPNEPDTVAWKSEGFVGPFGFDMQAVRSIAAAADVDPAVVADTDQLIEIRGGLLLAGELNSIDDQWVALSSRLLGTVRVKRSHVDAIVGANYAGQLVYSGPLDDERWTRIGKPEDWSFEGGVLVANRQGAGIVGNVDLPARASIHMVLSWRGVPNFVLSLGTMASNLVSPIEEVPAAARLEVFDQELVLLRELEDEAAIALLSDLSGGVTEIDLTIYLDQEAGTVIVCDAYGRPLETMQLPPERATVRSAVHLVNHGPNLRVEQFEVREWDGVASSLTARGAGQVLMDGETIAGRITGFDSQTQELVIQPKVGEETIRLPLSRLQRGDVLAVDDAEGDRPSAASQDKERPTATAPHEAGATASDPSQPRTNEQSEPEESDEPDDQVRFADLFEDSTAPRDEGNAKQPEPAIVDVILSDQSRIRGTWLSGDAKAIRFSAECLEEPLLFPVEAVRGLIGTSERFPIDLINKKNGTLKIGDSQLDGHLVDTPAEAEATGLFWHPHGSRTAAEISDQASGAIVYLRPLPNRPTNSSSTIAPAEGAAGPLVRMFLGGGVRAIPQANQPAPRADDKARSAESGEMQFRTGDAIQGVIQSIDERGITFNSEQTDTTFVPHEQIQQVQLNPLRQAIAASPEELKRLMTVPRSRKDDPPTHLFVSIKGDYLRGRLVRLEDQTLTVEIRLELMEIPAENVAQIVWLHDRAWKDPKKSTEQAEAREQNDQPFRVHLIARGEKGLTFRPQRVAHGSIHGESDLLGFCSLEIKKLNQMLFGRDIGAQLRQFQENPWTLALAQYPRVFAEASDGISPDAGQSSRLVGMPAPDFALKDLDGEQFRLSENRQGIVVLDFWASWCGPCMQTMPQVEEVVDEFSEDVQLVAVNIQETATRAQAAIERLELGSMVLLDIDGQIAAAYEANAIPQTVIVDREGNVTHVFVGGGSKFVTQFRAALTSLVGE